MLAQELNLVRRERETVAESPGSVLGSHVDVEPPVAFSPNEPLLGKSSHHLERGVGQRRHAAFAGYTGRLLTVLGQFSKSLEQ